MSYVSIPHIIIKIDQFWYKWRNGHGELEIGNGRCQDEHVYSTEGLIKGIKISMFWHAKYFDIIIRV